MTNEQGKPEPRGGIRRVGRKDRKKSLERPESLFLPDDTADTQSSAALPDAGEETAPNPAAAALFMPGPMDYAPPDSAPDTPVPPPQAAPPRRRFTRQDAIALLFALSTLGLCAYFALLWFNPYSPLNPLAPPTPLPRVITATPFNSGSAQDSAMFTPAAGTEGLYPFVLAATGVIYIPNANSSACNWASIAGTVSDNSGLPINGYRIRITSPDDPGLDETIFSGSTLTFGPGGYELPLGGAPVAGDYRVRLLDARGAPVSPEYAVRTRAECDGNVALVNFVQVR